ncbi:hypothetical protein MMC26_004502 [Xylographa opegraphella]|nr:hypothetical protein [Xylographa opegraphella]
MELRLIVQAMQSDSTVPIVVLDGKKWQLTTLSSTSVSEATAKYICISYLWGSGRSLNPFDSINTISDRTIEALEVVMMATRGHEVDGYWVDAICIPQSGTQRQATLESMGYIYAHATEVVVTLSQPVYSVMKNMEMTGPLDEDVLQLLEQDEWIASVWTYQELVNSRPSFVSFDRSMAGLIVEASDFFHGLAFYLELYRRKHKVTSFQVQKLFPRLSAFEDSMLVWRCNAPLNISALQVMSNMDRRVYRAGEPQNYFYAMMGAITTVSTWGAGGATVAEVSDRFMRMCERKNDYSFIYASTVREDRVGRRWRPAPGPMKSILAWHSYGDSASGYYDTAGFWLCEMLTHEISESVGVSGKEIIVQRFQLSGRAFDSDEALAGLVYETLVSIDFTGSPEYVTVVDGFVFPQTSLPRDSKLTILVSGNVVWPFGAPGLVIATQADDLPVYVPCAFIGDKTRRASSSVLIDAWARAE